MSTRLWLYLEIATRERSMIKDLTSRISIPAELAMVTWVALEAWTPTTCLACLWELRVAVAFLAAILERDEVDLEGVATACLVDIQASASNSDENM